MLSKSGTLYISLKVRETEQILDSVKEDMLLKAVNSLMIADRDVWKSSTWCVHTDKGRSMDITDPSSGLPLGDKGLGGWLSWILS